MVAYLPKRKDKRSGGNHRNSTFALGASNEVFLCLGDYWLPGGLSSSTGTDGRVKAQPGGIGFANSCPELLQGDPNGLMHACTSNPLSSSVSTVTGVPKPACLPSVRAEAL